ncbi:uncharacterized protein PAC_06111 [Phialocephala subalpina]|uniref:GRF-like zinc ribbon domain-containing protein n=1 Tax=Phialocephala subalpina TaxID=576137 RepID=A0A1L7WTY2_9HELO|nr:uncharacterized protein PAC_06111 [Phialocephala subalpina]
MTIKNIPIPIFPLFPSPKCRYCNKTSTRHKVSTGNTNIIANKGRPYYICEVCNGVSSSGWVSWDDKIGIHVSNPACDCGVVSRRDTAGAGTKMGKGNKFFTCAWGGCGFFRAVPNVLEVDTTLPSS